MEGQEKDLLIAIEGLKNEKAGLEREKSELKTAADKNMEERARIEGDIKGLNAQIGQLTQRKEGLSTDITRLEERKRALEAQIDQAKPKAVEFTKSAKAPK